MPNTPPAAFGDAYVTTEDTQLSITRPRSGLILELMDLDEAIVGGDPLADNPFGEVVFTIDGVAHTLTWSAPGDADRPTTYAELLGDIRATLAADPALAMLSADFGPSFVGTDSDATPGGSATGRSIMISTRGSEELAPIAMVATATPPLAKDFHTSFTVLSPPPAPARSRLTIDLMDIDAAILGRDPLEENPFGQVVFKIGDVVHSLTWSDLSDPAPPTTYPALLARIQSLLTADTAFAGLSAALGDSFTALDTDADPGGSAIGTSIVITNSGPELLTPVSMVATRTAPIARDFYTGFFGDLDGKATSVIDNDRDADGDTLGAILVAGTSHGALTFYSDGSFDYVPDANFTGVDTFSYVANDSQDDSAPVTVRITVRPVNDAPLAAADVTRVDEDATVTGNVITGVTTPAAIPDNPADSDGDGDTLAVSLVAGVAPGGTVAGAYGTLTLAADGSYSYVADADVLDILATGTAGIVDTFAYTISDGHGLTSSATLTVNVAIVDDAVTTSGGNGGGTLTGTAGDDHISGGNGSDVASGGDGADRLYGGNGVDTLNGGAGFDYLDGGNGRDKLDGGSGQDVLRGGTANDTLTGGSGADVFAYGLGDGGRDRITDFVVGSDAIYLAPGLTVTANVEIAGATLLTLSSGAQIELASVTGLGGVSAGLLTPALPVWTSGWLVI